MVTLKQTLTQARRTAFEACLRMDYALRGTANAFNSLTEIVRNNKFDSFAATVGGFGTALFGADAFSYLVRGVGLDGSVPLISAGDAGKFMVLSSLLSATVTAGFIHLIGNNNRELAELSKRAHRGS